MGVLTGGVVVFSLLRRSEIPEPVRSLDGNLAHVLAYFVLTTFATTCVRSWSSALWAATSMALLGLGVELLQLAAPGRGFEAKDISANLVGVGAGLLVGRLLLRLFVRRDLSKALSDVDAAKS